MLLLGFKITFNKNRARICHLKVCWSMYEKYFCAQMLYIRNMEYVSPLAQTCILMFGVWTHSLKWIIENIDLHP